MAIYKVRIINENLDLDHTLDIAEDEYILDITDEKGIRLPSGCMQGECSCCVGKLLNGNRYKQNSLQKL